jgi:hypothetical protein
MVILPPLEILKFQFGIVVDVVYNTDELLATTGNPNRLFCKMDGDRKLSNRTFCDASESTLNLA